MKIDRSNSFVVPQNGTQGSTPANRNMVAPNSRNVFESKPSGQAPLSIRPEALPFNDLVIPQTTSSGPQVPADGSYPTVDQTNQIAAMTDPVKRNYAITQAYGDLSNALGAMLGKDNANWSTFATWASKQAGVSIRQEDVPLLEKAIQDAQGPAKALEGLNNVLKGLGIPGIPMLDDLILGSGKTLDNMSAQLADGNRKVFAEMGPEFALFVQTFKGDTHYDQAKVDQYLQHFTADQPLLKSGFAAYAKAMFEQDPKLKAQEMLYANDEIGLEEQTKLQPQIAGALNAPAGMFKQLVNDAIDSAIDTLPWPAKDIARAALDHTGLRDKITGPVVSGMEDIYRHAATSMMMKLGLPGGETLQLGNDLPNAPGAHGYPADLQNIDYPPLAQLVAQIDHHPGTGPTGSAAHDWSSLSDRMQYIGDLFRDRQQQGNLFDPPFGHPGSYPVPAAVA